MKVSLQPRRGDRLRSGYQRSIVGFVYPGRGRSDTRRVRWRWQEYFRVHRG